VDCRIAFDTAGDALASLGGVWVRELVVVGIAGRRLREAARCAYLASMSSASRRAARDRARTSAVAIDTPTGRDIAGMSLVVVSVRRSACREDCEGCEERALVPEPRRTEGGRW
jgi:hypothetical protein